MLHSSHHVVYLDVLKITLMYACMHIYCYVLMIDFGNKCVCLFIQWTMYMMLISYAIYNRLGRVVNESIPNISNTSVTHPGTLKEWKSCHQKTRIELYRRVVSYIN